LNSSISFFLRNFFFEIIFNNAKKLKQTPELGIIATVKLNSEMDIAPDIKKDEKVGEDQKDPVTGSIYFMISSQPLLMEFMAAHP